MDGRTHRFGPFPPLSSPKDSTTPKSGNLFVSKPRSSGHSTMAVQVNMWKCSTCIDVCLNFAAYTSGLSKNAVLVSVGWYVPYPSIDTFSKRFVSIDGYEINGIRRFESFCSFSQQQIFPKSSNQKATRKGQYTTTKKSTTLRSFR